MKQTIPLAILLIAIFLSSCKGQENRQADESSAEVSSVSAVPDNSGATVAFSLTSPDFQPGEPIPTRFTCDGENVSPGLQWSGLPAGTQSLALVMDDTDAHGFVHWLLYNLPGNTSRLAEAQPKDESLPDGSVQGQNSFEKMGYDGPCPPSGTHHYKFILYALDTVFHLAPKVDQDSLTKALEGHILAQAELVGTYTHP